MYSNGKRCNTEVENKHQANNDNGWRVIVFVEEKVMKIMGLYFEIKEQERDFEASKQEV